MFAILLTNSQLFLMLYSDDVNGGKRVTKYLAVLPVAVSTFVMIGLNVKFSMVSFSFKINEVLMIWDVFVSNLLHPQT